MVSRRAFLVTVDVAECKVDECSFHVSCWSDLGHGEGRDDAVAILTYLFLKLSRMSDYLN